MQRRLFLQSGSATAVAAALTACGGGGGGASPASGSVSSAPLATGVETAPAAAAAAPAAQGLSAMPDKVFGCYFTAWDTSYRITDVPTDFNVIYLFNAQNGGTNTGDGSWTWPFGADVTPAQIQQVRQRGQRVILTIGGAGLGYVYTDRTQSTNCVNSLKSIIDQMGGVDGLDFNNYEAGIVTAGTLSAMCTEMVWIAEQMRAAYGAGFAITSPAGASDTTDGNLMLALKNAGMLTYVAPQHYDWTYWNSVGAISNSVNNWATLVGENSLCVGFSANYANGPSLSDCVREWDTIKAAHPNIRGMFCWSAQTNLNGGNTWGSAMKPSL